MIRERILRLVPNKTPTLDRLFNALADPTRRAVVERLGRGPAGVTELASPFAMALPSFTQHLGVLEACGLVRSEKHGRIRTYALEPGRLAEAEHWMVQQRRLWQSRLNQLDTLLLNQKENNS